MARNKANRGKGKTIVAAFGSVTVSGQAYNAVLMATQRKGKGAMFTQLWAVVPGQGSKAPAFALTVGIAPIGLNQAHACTVAQAQALYNAHPRRVASGAGSPAAQFGLAPAPVPAAKGKAAAAPAAGGSSPA